MSRARDVWLCGRHPIICGDSTDPETIAQLVGETRVRQVLADPPYKVTTASIAGTGRHGDFAMAAGEMSEERFYLVLDQLSNCGDALSRRRRIGLGDLLD